MTETLSLMPLSLNLPSSRMSVDFSSFTTDFTVPLAPYSNKPRAQRSQNSARKAVPLRTTSDTSLPELSEEPSAEPITSAAPSRQTSLRWPWKKSNPGNAEQFDSPIVALARNESTTSMASTASTSVSSVFSRANSVSTHTSSSSALYLDAEFPVKEVSRLSILPLSLLEQILSYSLGLPLQVSVGPDESDSRHMHHRYHRAGLGYVDLRQVLKNPLFLVSHHIRDVALDVFHRKSDFIVDLHRIYHSKVSSTINANLKRHQKFWISDTPTIVRYSLRKLSKLHLRLPVPSTEAAVHRDRNEDDWMDGSDGKGGGNWKVRSMKKEQEDALEVQKCIEAIKDLVMTDTGIEAEARPLSRSRSVMPIRRTKSMKSVRSKSADTADSRSHSVSNADDNGGKRGPLRRLVLVLVKRSPWALVLPESLGLVRAFRSVPVSGYTKYYFELHDQQRIWAMKHRKRWQGMEPDGYRLLNDLQGLTIAEPPIEPIQTPTEFKFVNVDHKGQLRLRDTALPKTPIVLETPRIPEKYLPADPTIPKTSIIMKALPWSRKRPGERSDSFSLMMEEGIKEIGSSATNASGGRIKAPTVDELKQIAEDIKNGLY